MLQKGTERSVKLAKNLADDVINCLKARVAPKSVERRLQKGFTSSSQSIAAPCTDYQSLGLLPQWARGLLGYK